VLEFLFLKTSKFKDKFSPIKGGKENFILISFYLILELNCIFIISQLDLIVILIVN
jgi:hypothetical protein